MVRITLDLIRKKSEHNESVLSTLEEIALHQLDIEKLEIIGQNCPKLKILLLQNNLIPKIENIRQLKELRYLNLALNLITRIEGLEECEFLDKLDLTANFVVDILSVENLRRNEHLRVIYFTGNPCCDYEGFRLYVVASLPQLQQLDGDTITQTERLRAEQEMRNGLRERIEAQQKAGMEKFNIHREKQRRENEMKRIEQEKKDKQELDKQLEQLDIEEKILLQQYEQERKKGNQFMNVEDNNQNIEKDKDKDKDQLKEKEILNGNDIISVEKEEEDKQQQNKAKSIWSTNPNEELDQIKEDNKQDKQDNNEQKLNEQIKDGDEEDDMPELEKTDIFAYTPEVRLETHRELERKKNEEDVQIKAKKEKQIREEKEKEEKRRRLVKEDGTIIQKNEGQWPFRFYEDHPPGTITLEVKLSKFLDTTLIQSEVNPFHVTLTIKGKVLQLKLPSEVYSDRANATRSEATGVLRIECPKVNPNTSFYGGPDYDPTENMPDPITGKKKPTPLSKRPLAYSTVTGEFGNSSDEIRGRTSKY
ncbi:MAG: putative protein tilB [Streblomastix strix]|uniref:Dynein axonemal assembly factor 11-like CS domain-containing protein n=1 Tax=Streblomastix strix TaxID=222440 RepID=A0A5J4X252_9EUKA|nr:MAG: putative protein tilB [Streblomastix strix]KAA6401334.1 MAG: putative protein tilB [Streblomastix strix]